MDDGDCHSYSQKAFAFILSKMDSEVRTQTVPPIIQRVALHPSCPSDPVSICLEVLACRGAC